jgi:hypothetical protein
MKTALATVLIAFACLSASASAFHSGDEKALTDKQLASIRESIISNLTDECCDIRTSTLQLVIELRQAYPTMDLDYAIIPIMRVLKSDDVPGLRILAACALNCFDSDMGRYAVTRRALYDSNDRVAHHCAALMRSWTVKALPEGIAENTW